MSEEQVIAFIQAHIKSVWALELLILLTEDRNRGWQQEELVRVMRSSAGAIDEAIKNLQAASIVATDADGRYSFAPTSADLDELATGVRNIYGAKPATVVRAIMTAPENKLRIFADAFKFRNQ